MSIFLSLKSTRTTTTAATTRRRWWSKTVGKRRQKTATATLQLTLIGHGREPWSSGYERRLTFQRLRVLIAAPYTGWTFFTLICCKKRNDVWLKRQKINDKIGLGWPIYKKNEQKIWSNTKCINLVMLSFFKMGQSRPFIYFRPFLISIAVDTTELWPFSCDSLFRKIVLFSFQFQ